ncbi:autotransporter domain-containing protein [Metallibacterium scheffleri]|uniref:autotransporter domain-containing protein n=1 Tax=Metallibacterium scheffleri TaxID=993689 RepID=UPI0023F01DA3|nr:autotransporter domain-containing protein [Metallibacterium scheffleri]
MLRTRTLAIAVGLALALGTGAAQASPFSKIFVFGDSLSDDGNLSLALTNGTVQNSFTTNPGQVTMQDVATYFGYGLTPSLLGGTDFAWGGAGLLNNSPGTPSTVPLLTAQLQQYLTASGGKADPTALYSVWGGANDIFYNAYVAGIGGQTAQQAQFNIIAAAQTEGGMLATLKGAGARYILVFNLPNIGATPSAAAQGPAAQQALTGLTLTFNNTLDQAIQQVNPGVNIIPVNVYGMLNELLANPALYGFSNVTTPACGITASAVQCGPAGSGAPYTYAPGTQNTYLFADGVHPTTAGYALLGQYVESIINAPAQMSLLPQAPLAAYAAHQRALRDEMLVDSLGEARKGVHFFANYDYGHQTYDATANTMRSTSNNNVLTIGANAAANRNFSVGMAIGAAQLNTGGVGAVSFKTQDLLFSGFANARFGAAYLSGNASIGQLSYTNIVRYIPLGPALRVENGKTSGSQLAGTLEGGYWFDWGNLRTGPFAQLGYQRVSADPFSESSGDASAMTFGKQVVKAATAELGWQLTGRTALGGVPLQPFARVSYEHDSDAQAQLVSAGLTTMPGTFALPGFVPDKNWVNASLGLSARFSPSLTGFASYTGMFSNNSQKLNSIDLGVSMTF